VNNREKTTTHFLIDEPRGAEGTAVLWLSALSIPPGCNRTNDLGDDGGGSGGRRLSFERDKIDFFFESSASLGFKGTTKGMR
jgi:hypothetical protein